MDFKQFLEDERSQLRHHALVRLLARYWLRLGYGRVRVAHGLLKGLEEPEPVQPGNRIPDVTAHRPTDGVFLIAEAETERGLGDDHTRQQWQDFHKAAVAAKAEFHVVVPASAEGVARALAEECGVTLHGILAVPDEVLPQHPILG